jgi:N-[(2S)-2-amino-2-carboxyethyl]-L-glutamate dehydrogenase
LKTAGSVSAQPSATTPAADALLYLDRAQVEALSREIDPVAAVRDALLLHAERVTALPDEAYLQWTAPGGAFARSLAMPGYLGGTVGAAGTKLINASLGNRALGLPRASGLLVLFDLATARPSCVMEASFISALRTASVTVLAAQALGRRPLRSAALLGCGDLAAAHLRLLAERLELAEVTVYDVDAGRAEEFVRRFEGGLGAGAPKLRLASDPRAAVDGADLVVPVTTTTEGYIAHGWLRPGALVVNVSLDDLLPEVMERADLLVVDDWNLVRADSRRLLGRMARQGRIVGPAEEPPAGARGVDGELGAVLLGDLGRRHPEDIVVVNPFGLAIEDVAVAERVHRLARARGAGLSLPR